MSEGLKLVNEIYRRLLQSSQPIDKVDNTFVVIARTIDLIDSDKLIKERALEYWLKQ